MRKNSGQGLIFLQGVVKDDLPNLSKGCHLKKNTISESKLIFRFRLKITKTNQCFMWINWHGLVHHKTSNVR